MLLGELAKTGVHPGSSNGTSRNLLARFGADTWDPIRDRFDARPALITSSTAAED